MYYVHHVVGTQSSKFCENIIRRQRVMTMIKEIIFASLRNALGTLKHFFENSEHAAEGPFVVGGMP